MKIWSQFFAQYKVCDSNKAGIKAGNTKLGGVVESLEWYSKEFTFFLKRHGTQLQYRLAIVFQNGKRFIVALSSCVTYTLG